MHRSGKRLKWDQTTTSDGIVEVEMDDPWEEEQSAINDTDAMSTAMATDTEMATDDERDGPNDDVATPANALGPSNLPQKKAKLRDQYLERWLEQKGDFLDAMVALEAPEEGTMRCTMCGSTDTDLHRCKDCFNPADLHCAGCIVELHRDSPLHRIEVSAIKDAQWHI